MFLRGGWRRCCCLCARALLTYVLDTAKDSFTVILQVGAGTGLLYLLRWFWWRINAWCEVVAMISSFLVSVVFFVMNKCHVAWVTEAVTASLTQAYGDQPKVLAEKLAAATANIGPYISADKALVLTVLITTACWLFTAYFGPQTDMETLIAFYKKVRPAGPGWEPVRRVAGVSKEEARATGDNLPLAMVGFTAGVCAIWSSLFTVGKFLYGQYGAGCVLLVVFAVSSAVLVVVTNRIWSKKAVVEVVERARILMTKNE